MKIQCPHCRYRFQSDSSPAPETMIECGKCKNLFLYNPPAQSCPNCLARMKPDARVCLECGWDMIDGKVVSHEPNPDEDLPLPLRLLAKIVDLAPGMFRLPTLIGAIILTVIALMVGWIALFIMGLGAIMSGFAVAVVAMYIYAQALAFIFSGSVQLLKQSMSDMEGARWEAFLVMLVTPVILFCLLLVVIGNIING